jgi:membrane-bound metal-dependent hydrolase YbcI (DUF457 family)
MPQVVFHILLPLVLMALFKDWYDAKHKKKFSLHYVLIAGIAGLLPDIDIIAFWFMHFLGFTIGEVHRTFTHNIFFPLVFFISYFLFKGNIVLDIRKHKIDLGIVFLMIAFGFLIHIILDGVFHGEIMPLYPFSLVSVGFNLVGYLPSPLDEMFLPSLDAILLFIWLIYLEFKHKVSDYI